jgi:AcrR family transcriptional regulator
VAAPHARSGTLETGEPGRRYRGQSPEERRADQRQRLVRAAIDEFGTRGYHHTSVEDIVRRARTSRTAFYALFDNREDAMYGALQQSLRTLLGRVREAVVAAGPDDDLIAVGISAYVECLTADPAAAAVVLIEGIGVSAEVNALRSRIRRELAEMLRSVWSRYDPDAAEAPHAQAISMGVLGIIIESMEHLVETGRLADAPEHVPALVSAVERVFEPRG